jgi:hypothetical protein
MDKPGVNGIIWSTELVWVRRVRDKLRQIGSRGELSTHPGKLEKNYRAEK